MFIVNISVLFIMYYIIRSLYVREYKYLKHSQIRCLAPNVELITYNAFFQLIIFPMMCYYLRLTLILILLICYYSIIHYFSVKWFKIFFASDYLIVKTTLNFSVYLFTIITIIHYAIKK